MSSWQVRVEVKEAREIKGKGSNGLSDPIVSVQVRDQKQYTARFENTTAARWNHLFFFNFESSKEEMETTSIDVSLWDSQTFSDVLIGKYSLGCGFVYEKPQHELYKQWMALNNMEEFGTEVQAYLQISAWVLGENESAPSHTEGDDDGESNNFDESSMVLAPPSLKSQGYHLFVRVYKAESLPDLDAWSACDAFVQVKFGTSPPVRTKTISNSANPVWNTELRLPVLVPVLANNILVEIYDESSVGGITTTKLIGKCVAKFSSIMLGDMPPTWFNLYGHASQSSAANLLATSVATIQEWINPLSEEIPATAPPSAYNGRLLIAMEAAKADAPKLGTKAIAAANAPKTDMYILWIDLYEGSELCVNDWLFETCYVEIQFGSTVLQSTIVTPSSGQCQWYHSFEELRIGLPANIEEIFDLFIHVYKKSVVGLSTRIGYIRLPMVSINGFDQKPVWGMLSPDPKNRKQTGPIPGFVQYEIKFGRERDKPGKGRKKTKKPQKTLYELRAHIYQGRNFKAKDEDGANDPYIVVRFGGKSRRTPTIKKTLAPIFYTTLTLDVEVPSPMSLAPEIYLVVWDEDDISDDVIGRLTLPAEKAKRSFPLLPKWRHIYHEDPTVSQGEVLCSFQLIPKSEVSQYPLAPIVPEMRQCIFEISVIGVRDLASYMLMDIDAPYLTFNISDMKNDPNNTKTTKIGKGPNSNFLQTIPFPIPVPSNPLFTINLDIKCFDNRTFQPLIAMASIDISKYIRWQPPVIEEESSDEEEDNTKKEPDGEIIAPEHELWNHDFHEAVVFTTSSEKGKSKKSRVPESEIAEEEESTNANERNRIDHELENLFTKLPFEEINLIRGNSDSKLFGGSRQVGSLKAQFRLIELSKRNLYPAPVVLKEVYAPKIYMVRVYILRGINLAPMDGNGLSDPYALIQISEGKEEGQKISFVDNCQAETLNPDLYVCGEMKVGLPGASNLYVEIWDHDSIDPDDLIGNTKIDLETRVLSDEWKALKLKPIECRTLRNPKRSPKISQGKVELWVDILTPEQALAAPMQALERPTPAQFTLRVVIWNCREIVNLESEETDAYVTGQLSGVEDSHRQETDTHPRSSDKENPPVFNYRFIFPLELYTNMDKNPRLQLSIWDRDLIGSDDALGEALISLKPLFKTAMKKKESVKMENFWVKCTHPNYSGVRGQIKISLEVLPTADHELSPVGKGRDPPNENPFLPTPIRPGLFDGLLDMLNPWKKLKRCCCIIVTIAIVVVGLYLALKLA